MPQLEQQSTARHRELDRILTEALLRCAAGDVLGFTQLYRASSPRIYGLALRVLRSPDHAAEVTQEVYLEVWRQAARFNPDRGSVLGWITTIAHRRAVDRVRSVASGTARDQRYVDAGRCWEVDEVWDSVALRFDVVTIRTALSRLTPLQRQALVLAYYQGHTQSQIAALLDLPLGTVKTRVRSGLIALRTSLPSKTLGDH